MELGLPAAHEHLALGAALRAGTEQESRRELKPTNGSWESTKRTFARVEAGGTCIVPSIPAVPRSTFGFPLNATRRRPSSSSRKPCRLLVIPGRGSSP